MDVRWHTRTTSAGSIQLGLGKGEMCRAALYTGTIVAAKLNSNSPRARSLLPPPPPQSLRQPPIVNAHGRPPHTRPETQHIDVHTLFFLFPFDRRSHRNESTQHVPMPLGNTHAPYPLAQQLAALRHRLQIFFFVFFRGLFDDATGSILWINPPRRIYFLLFFSSSFLPFSLLGCE